MSRSAEHAKRLYGLVYPRDTWGVAVGSRAGPVWQVAVYVREPR